MKIEHIGIAVKHLSSSIPLFEKLLNTPCYKTEAVESELVNTAFFFKDETKIELIEGYSPKSPIYKFIEKKGEGDCEAWYFDYYKCIDKCVSFFCLACFSDFGNGGIAKSSHVFSSLIAEST